MTSPERRLLRATLMGKLGCWRVRDGVLVAVLYLCSHSWVPQRCCKHRRMCVYEPSTATQHTAANVHAAAQGLTSRGQEHATKLLIEVRAALSLGA